MPPLSEINCIRVQEYRNEYIACAVFSSCIDKISIASRFTPGFRDGTATWKRIRNPCRKSGMI